MNAAEEQFDFIIAGAGSAGCVLAARLTESGQYTALLIEAGPEDRSLWISMPLGVERLFKEPRYNWMYQSEPVPGLGNRRLYEPRGRVLGGSSSINGMVYVRGNALDYDQWQQMGCTGWGYEDVLPYFRKAEDQERGADRYHGVGGPLSVSDPIEKTELMDAIIEAAVQSGIPRNPDFNGAEQDGAGYYQSTMRRGRRCSTARGYLAPARRRSNLKVVTEARATRILFDQGRAEGLEYRTSAGTRTAKARREVIVASGALASPQLLMLSGIGPSGHLASHGINVLLDSPHVGSNMADHVASSIQFRCEKKAGLNQFAHSWLRQIIGGMQYLFLHRGPCTEGMPGAMFTRSDPRLDRPDIQLQLFPWTFADTSTARTITHKFPGFAMQFQNLHPSCSGTVRLASADPFAPPAIAPDLLGNAEDVAIMVKAMLIARDIVSRPAMESFRSQELEPSVHCRSQTEMADYIRQTAGSTLHAVGTCRMGVPGVGVVDPRLRVYGVDGLRVVDASIMPVVPSANINAPTIMVAEKASDMILADAR